MTHYAFPSVLALCAAALGLNIAPPVRAAAPANRPNIIFVLIDDMGYGDLSVTGNKDVRTINMDRLAAEGIRFTQFYANSPICSP